MKKGVQCWCKRVKHVSMINASKIVDRKKFGSFISFILLTHDVHGKPEHVKSTSRLKTDAQIDYLQLKINETNMKK